LEKVREQLKVAKERAILVGALLKSKKRPAENLMELSCLAETAGAIVVDRFIQRIGRINPATYIGKGKAADLGGRVRRFKADVVIFNNDLSPAQIRELEKILEVKVVDRSELILDIFATRAQTKQAKLQVELAQLEYTYPRLTKMWSHLDSVAGAGGATKAGAVGGIGTRGTGEKQLEIDRRIVNKRISELKRELVKIEKRRERETNSRREYFRVCLVGYTNAGKSTLMNALTDAGVFVEDRLFATLDTRTRQWVPESGVTVLLSDTVGFVRNLPHQLVESFKATLEETVTADLLIHVVDVSSGDAYDQVKSVETVLKEIGCADKPVIFVLNKVDAIETREQLDLLKTLYAESISISARTGIGLGELAGEVIERFHGDVIHVMLEVPASNGKIQSYLRAKGRIVTEEYVDSTVKIEAVLGSNQLDNLKRLKPENLKIL